MKVKELVKMPEPKYIQHKILDSIENLERNSNIGYNYALQEIGNLDVPVQMLDEKEIRIKYQDIVYKICLLFDTKEHKCGIWEVIDKVRALKFAVPAVKTLNVQNESNGLVPLDEEELITLWYKKYIIEKDVYKFIREICQTFGQPAKPVKKLCEHGAIPPNCIPCNIKLSEKPSVPSPEELGKVAYEQYMKNANIEGKWEINLTDVGKEHWTKVGKAIHALLQNKGE